MDGFKALSRVRQLEEAFEKLKREQNGRMEALEVEWSDMLHRFRRIMGRIEKTAARDAAREDDPETIVTSDGKMHAVQGLDPISQKILARRRRLPAPEAKGE